MIAAQVGASQYGLNDNAKKRVEYIKQLQKKNINIYKQLNKNKLPEPTSNDSISNKNILRFILLAYIAPELLINVEPG